MAFRNKKPAEPAKNTTDDVQKAKDIITGGADAVNQAANKLLGTLKNPAIDEKWLEMKRRVTEADRDFKDEYMNNPFENNVDVRVMQVRPDGRLIDVSDRIKPQDVRPDQIADFQSEGLNIPRDRAGRIDREAAMDLLSQILGSGRRGTASANNTSTESIRRMQVALEASDKTLEHWKK